MNNTTKSESIIFLNGLSSSVRKCLTGPYQDFEGEVVVNPIKIPNISIFDKDKDRFPNVTFRSGITAEDLYEFFGAQISNTPKPVADMFVRPHKDETLRYLEWEHILRKKVLDNEKLFNEIKPLSPEQFIEKYGVEFLQENLVSTIAYNRKTGYSTTHLRDRDEATIYSSKETRRKRRDAFMAQALAQLKKDDIEAGPEEGPEVSRALHYKPVFEETYFDDVNGTF